VTPASPREPPRAPASPLASRAGFGYALASLLKKGSTATIIGFAIVILGWIFQAVIQFGVPYTAEYYDYEGYSVSVIFGLMPWNLLAKGLLDLGSATVGELGGLHISEATSYCKDRTSALKALDAEVLRECYPRDASKFVNCACVMPVGQIMGIFVAEWAFYTLLSVFLDNVLPQEMGARRPLLYFLTPGYWSASFADRDVERSGARTLKCIDLGKATCHSTDEDVVEAFDQRRARLEAITRGGEPLASDEVAVELFNLRKVFSGILGRKKFEAVKGTWLGINHSELFCLLGPNGAGKTTTINMLTGALMPSAGEAVVYGELLQSAGGLDRIRAMMGVCPQFDVLWPMLSGREHMRLYGILKGVGRDYLEGHVAELLGQVHLTSAATVRTSGYSGGMKRRLSVAIALLGDPRVVFLDEPTTGMDPISRRHVWDIIEAAKKGRVIVLTTHSMEEADILGDRIAIMARGTVRCVGSSLRLKARYGSGYSVAVAVGSRDGDAAARRDAVVGLFRDRLGVPLADDTGAYLSFQIPRERVSDVVPLLEHLERSRAALGIDDVQLSMASLEEVFLAIAKQAEVDAAAEGGRTLRDFVLPDGTKLKVPLGLDVFTDAAGATWRVVWAQGEDGTLDILDVKLHSAPGEEGPQ